MPVIHVVSTVIIAPKALFEKVEVTYWDRAEYENFGRRLWLFERLDDPRASGFDLSEKFSAMAGYGKAAKKYVL